MDRYICVHGHFYQPPRETPWLEAIEVQDSAFPYHDWNERIAAESYAPNAAARILDGEGRVCEIVNNYASISFNFGPTLLAWLEFARPNVYRAIVAADHASRERFSGHGSAMAQAYNHMILPLGNSRDKRTQVIWGIRDFEHRFGRKPEGMWLAETAVDLETLDILAEHGIRFTLLAPNQARRTRRPKGREWHDVSDSRIDPTRAYLQRLPSGRSIALFFYDGPISRGVAFEGMLDRGENLAGRLVGAFSDERDWPQLVHVATDGETYGHHHSHGEMALAYALRHLEENPTIRVTNYAEYLELHPPEWEVDIFEGSSWSCVHGVDRWRADCGCNSGMHGGWHQQWRAPLREALDWLRDELEPRYETAARKLLADPWRARDAYIAVLLDRSPESLDRFFAAEQKRELSAEERVRALELLEQQRHAMLMYTSCGWFFDELSGIETVQVIQYAGRALQLASALDGGGLEEGFLERLERAPSNLPEHRDGRAIYEKFVRPAMVDLAKVGAHYAISSVFEEFGDRDEVFCYTIEREAFRKLEAGRASMAIGRARVTSVITGETALLTFGVLHLGDHNLAGGVRPFRGEDAYAALEREVCEPFARAEFTAALSVIDRHLGPSVYSLRSLFRDEQRRVLRRVLDTMLKGVVETYSRVYLDHQPVMRFLADLGTPLPHALSAATQVVLGADLCRALSAPDPDYERARAVFREAAEASVQLDTAAAQFALKEVLERQMEQLTEHPNDLEALRRVRSSVEQAVGLPLFVDTWRLQNLFFAELHPRLVASGGNGRQWREEVRALGERLGARVDVD